MPEFQSKTLGLSEVSQLLSLAPKRVTELVDKGIVPKKGRAQYDLLGAVHGYIAYLRGSRTGGSSEGEDRARLMKAKADLAEMEAAQVNGQLIDCDTVAAEWVDRTVRFKQRIRACAVKLGPLMVHVQSEAEAIQLIEQVHDEALTELGSDEIQGIESDRQRTLGGEQGDFASAEDDGEPVGGFESPAFE